MFGQRQRPAVGHAQGREVRGAQLFPRNRHNLVLLPLPLRNSCAQSALAKAHPLTPMPSKSALAMWTVLEKAAYGRKAGRSTPPKTPEMSKAASMLPASAWSHDRVGTGNAEAGTANPTG